MGGGGRAGEGALTQPARAGRAPGGPAQVGSQLHLLAPREKQRSLVLA